MKSTRLLLAVAVAVFFVVGLPGAASAQHATTADGSGTVTAQVTVDDAGAAPSAPCFEDEDGDWVCPCDDYGPLCK